MKAPSLQQLQRAISSKKYAWFDNGKDYYLNIVGIRSANRTPNKFDDWLGVAYKERGEWRFDAFECTTDPGTYWLENPGNVNGTAILKPGQYIDSWRLGLHQDKYEALTQAKPVTVIRDNDKDNELDFDAKKEETGLFGINIHRANQARASVQVDKWSAGCQVIADPVDFLRLVNLVKAAQKQGHKLFSYTLLEEKDLK